MQNIIETPESLDQTSFSTYAEEKKVDNRRYFNCYLPSLSARHCQIVDLLVWDGISSNWPFSNFPVNHISGNVCRTRLLWIYKVGWG